MLRLCRSVLQIRCYAYNTRCLKIFKYPNLDGIQTDGDLNWSLFFNVIDLAVPEHFSVFEDIKVVKKITNDFEHQNFHRIVNFLLNFHQKFC